MAADLEILDLEPEAETSVSSVSSVVPTSRESNSGKMDFYRAQISEGHRHASTHAKLAIAYALRAGLLLREVKVTVPHGNFESFVQSCEFSPRTARRYMKLAENVAERLDHDALALLTGEFDDTDLPQLADTLSNATSGQNLQQLYMEFGIVRTPAPIGGARTPTNAANGKAPAADLHAAREADIERMNVLCSQLETQIKAHADIRQKDFSKACAHMLRGLAQVLDSTTA